MPNRRVYSTREPDPPLRIGQVVTLKIPSILRGVVVAVAKNMVTVKWPNSRKPVTCSAHKLIPDDDDDDNGNEDTETDDQEWGKP